MNKEATGSEQVAFKRILVPLDGSALGETALPYAEQIAVANQSRLILLQVVTPYQFALADSSSANIGRIAQEFTESSVEEATNYLRAVSDRLAGKGLDVECHVEIGFPAERIVTYSREQEGDLIVMSTHGRSGINRWLLGSVADKVLHAAGVPVLLVRPRKGGDR